MILVLGFMFPLLLVLWYLEVIRVHYIETGKSSEEYNLLSALLES